MRPTRRSLPIALLAPAAVLAAVVASSCFQAESQVCPSGFTCPAGSQCAAAQEICITTRCGNGVREGDEVCDDGNVRSSDGCRADCRSNEECGNGIRDVATGEVCDDGDRESGDGCSADCRSLEGCGNGTRELDEECDDANDAGDDNCTPACTISFCGDGYVNDAGTPDGGHKEYCDELGESATCNSNCTGNRCGDFFVNASANEECDRGGIDTSTCNFNCTTRRCGDFYINGDAGEQCDNATNGMTACPYGTQSCTACNAACTGMVSLTGPFCGNGSTDVVDAGFEACDDSNTTTETACPYGTPSCTLCSADCSTALPLTGPFCGNLAIDALPDGGAESCDDPSRLITACAYGTPTCTACNVTCIGSRNLTGPFCGNGNTDVIDAGFEACDDGNTTTETACPYGTPSCARCSSNCGTALSLTGPFCGNLGIDTLPDGGTESCDDLSRSLTACAYGTPTCTACNATCTGQRNLTGPYCGNLAIDALPDGGVEACDDGNTTTETSCPYGTPTCTACNATCGAALNLVGLYCGDGARTGSEVCDDGNNAACGTCTLGCTQIQNGAATGKIFTVGSNNLVDGDSFELLDGTLQADGGFNAYVFEYDKDGLLTFPGSTMIAADAGGPNTMASKTANAINSVVPLEISASSSGLSNEVNLLNEQQGTGGNRPILEFVAHNNFTVNGMAGGGGADCPVGTGCVNDLDCAPGLTCQGAAGASTCEP